MCLALACSFPALISFAGQLPLTTKEISLMLRSGYSSAAVLKELSTRHLAEAIDVQAEISLRQAGATSDLIDALKKGTFSLPPAQATAAQKQITEAAKRTQTEGQRLRFDTLYRDQVTQQGSGGIIKTPAGGSSFVRDLVKDDLVSWQNGALTHFDDSKFEDKKLIAFYFSAHWCGPCRAFTPELVAYYNRVAPQHPEFEIVFVSSDRSADAMATYIHEANMPWPAIEYQKIPSKSGIMKYAGRGIPCLVVVDSTGKVISNSFDGLSYVGPKKVLADLDAIFAKGMVAQAR